jgi:hypothetical protein
MYTCKWTNSMEQNPSHEAQSLSWSRNSPSIMGPEMVSFLHIL